jgi:hypothetical protein
MNCKQDNESPQNVNAMNEETREERLTRWKSLKMGKPQEEVDAWEKELEAIKTGIYRTMTRSAGAPEQLSVFSWMPTKAARCSIFRPIADQKLKQEYTELVFRSSWGNVEVSGPPLNITDEGVFLAVLQIAREQNSNRIKIVKKRICEILGISVQGKNYKRIDRAIIKLWKTSFLIETKDGKYHGERLIEKMTGNVDFSWIMIDAWFFNNFLQNEITNLDMAFRQSLRGDVTKSLYRFLASHRGVQRYRTETLIDALNMPTDKDIKLNRSALKRAFNQLKARKYLSFKYDQNKDMFSDIDTSTNRNRKLIT